MKINRDKRYYILVKADPNDADYISKLNDITGEELEDIVLPVIEKIKLQGQRHNWCTSEYTSEGYPRKMYNLTDVQDEIMCEIVPYGEYGIHTIESILIFEYSEGSKLL